MNKNKYKRKKESSIATAFHNMGACPGCLREDISKIKGSPH